MSSTFIARKNTALFSAVFLAGSAGIEPAYADLEAAVLPLYELPGNN